VLAGFSEGARATAIYDGAEFAGKIILGTSCHSFNKALNGINGPSDLPVLAVSGSEDIYAKPESTRGDCGPFISHKRPFSQSVVLKGQPHQIVSLPETKTAVDDFLRNVAHPPDESLPVGRPTRQ
jgi:hypothetical protein